MSRTRSLHVMLWLLALLLLLAVACQAKVFVMEVSTSSGTLDLPPHSVSYLVAGIPKGDPVYDTATASIAVVVVNAPPLAPGTVVANLTRYDSLGNLVTSW